MNQTQKEHQKVKPPHHLQEPKKTKVLLYVEEGYIAKPCHPYVTTNKNADVVVHRAVVKIVVR